MWGFGEPTPGNSASAFPAGTAIDESADNPSHYAWGFGDPENYNNTPPGGNVAILAPGFDLGFGDKPAFTNSPVLLIGAAEDYPDEGGVIVTITAAFDEIGPYHVRLRETVTSKVFPETTNINGQLCNSGVPGLGVFCRPSKKPIVANEPAAQIGDTMRFTLPPLPPGIYDVEIFKTHLPSEVQTISAAIVVQWRGRDEHTYRIRRRLSSFFDAHIAAIGFEKRLGYPEGD